MTRQELFSQMVEHIQSLKAGLRERSGAHDALPFGQKAALYYIGTCNVINVKELARMLQITSGAVTQHVEALVQDGLVIRTEDPADRRGVIIKLSEDGKKMRKTLEQERLAIMESVFSNVSDQELEAFVATTKKISENINQQKE